MGFFITIFFFGELSLVLQKVRADLILKIIMDISHLIVLVR